MMPSSTYTRKKKKQTKQTKKRNLFPREAESSLSAMRFCGWRFLSVLHCQCEATAPTVHKKTESHESSYHPSKNLPIRALTDVALQRWHADSSPCCYSCISSRLEHAENAWPNHDCLSSNVQGDHTRIPNKTQWNARILSHYCFTTI